MSHFPSPPSGVFWEMQQSNKAHLEYLLVFPKSLLHRKMAFHSTSSNDMVFVFSLEFSSLFMNTNDFIFHYFWTLLSAYFFSSLEWSEVLFSSSFVLRVQLFTIISSVYLLLFCLDHSLFWPLLMLLILLLLSMFFYFSLGVLLPSPSFPSSWFIHS